MQVQINVNGHRHDIAAAPDTPLLYVLRNDLHLNAAKYGCGLGRCGSCTVHLDGQAVLSCMIPIGEIGDRPVTTLEGIGSANDLHPLQQAFIDEQAAQCGYCVAGIVMTAAALFEENPNPTEREIRDTLAGTLCRCGSQARMLRAIRRVATASKATE